MGIKLIRSNGRANYALPEPGIQPGRAIIPGVQIDLRAFKWFPMVFADQTVNNQRQLPRQLDLEPFALRKRSITMRVRPLAGLMIAGSFILALDPLVVGTDGTRNKLPPKVRGLVVQAQGPMRIDGKLEEWEQAFCTPVHYNHRNLDDRAGQFFYVWDREALYVGLRTLDTKVANPGGPRAIFDGDAIEFYLDTRSDGKFRSKDWTEGAVHLHMSGFDGSMVAPRWVVRPGIATSETKLEGVEMAATVDGKSVSLEFSIPWKNFPDFDLKPGAVLALDAELCSGDGGKRTDRTFASGSPLSVQQPASEAAVALVERIEGDEYAQVGPAAFPMRVDTPWIQDERAQVRAVVAIPPSLIDEVDSVEVRLHDADGVIVKTLMAPVESFGPHEFRFVRAVASWSIDDFAPNTYFATAKVKSKSGSSRLGFVPRSGSDEFRGSVSTPQPEC